MKLVNLLPRHSVSLETSSDIKLVFIIFSSNIKNWGFNYLLSVLMFRIKKFIDSPKNYTFLLFLFLFKSLPRKKNKSPQPGFEPTNSLLQMGSCQGYSVPQNCPWLLQIKSGKIKKALNVSSKRGLNLFFFGVFVPSGWIFFQDLFSAQVAILKDAVSR